MYIDENLVSTTYRDEVKRLIEQGGNGMTEKQFLEAEIRRWKASDERKMMLTGEAYYAGKHETILNRKHEAIGNDGKLMTVENLPNNKIIDNQYGKGVDQKTDYLVGKPIAFKAEDSTTGKAYSEALDTVFGKVFHKLLKTTARNALNHGIGWLYPYIEEDGSLRFKAFPGYEILPFWNDDDHTDLALAIRVYTVRGYVGNEQKQYEKVEIYGQNGVEFYDLSEDGELTPDGIKPRADYVVSADDNKGYNWGPVPLVAFKYNDSEIPLIQRARSLQDALNVMWSDWMNGMQSNPYNQILVVKNAEGQPLGEIRKNLAIYGAVKVRTVDGADGGVEALEVNVNAENYKTVIKELKKALIENMMCLDAKDDRMGGAPNQMNIRSMYADIDEDANGMETEFQSAMEQMRWIVDKYLVTQGLGDFSGEELEVIFNRDTMTDEASIMQTLNNSGLQLSNRTLVSQVPFVDNVDAELEQLEKEKQEAADLYGGGAFPPSVNGNKNTQDGPEGNGM